VARLPDGFTIEEHYQLRIKGYGTLGVDNWRIGKGKPALDPSVDLYAAYKDLWRIWADHNPHLLKELAMLAVEKNYLLSDCFATTPVSQARVLAELLNERGY
jgi:hypothetical protein